MIRLNRLTRCRLSEVQSKKRTFWVFKPLTENQFVKLPESCPEFVFLQIFEPFEVHAINMAITRVCANVESTLANPNGLTPTPSIFRFMTATIKRTNWTVPMWLRIGQRMAIQMEVRIGRETRKEIQEEMLIRRKKQIGRRTQMLVRHSKSIRLIRRLEKGVRRCCGAKEPLAICLCAGSNSKRIVW